jgi:hypothetical protein
LTEPPWALGSCLNLAPPPGLPILAPACCRRFYPLTGVRVETSRRYLGSECVLFSSIYCFGLLFTRPGDQPRHATDAST